MRVTERILNGFQKKVEALRKVGADMDDFDTFEVSGIAGTQMEDTLSFDVASWLVKRIPNKVEIAWENYEAGRELGTSGPRFIPLLEDHAFVEADTPRTLWHNERPSVGGSAGRSWHGRSRSRGGHLSLEPSGLSTSPAARVCRGIDAVEWCAVQLQRSHRGLRVDGGRRHHLLHLPRR